MSLGIPHMKAVGRILLAWLAIAMLIVAGPWVLVAFLILRFLK